MSAVKARHLGRTGVIVEDRVSLVGDTSGEEGTLARIVAVAERETVLRRPRTTTTRTSGRSSPTPTSWSS